MWMSDNWSDGKLFSCDVKHATRYYKGPDGHKDYLDETSHWVQLNCDAKQVSLRLTAEQIESIHAQLGAYLQDISRQAHPEACQGSEEVLCVIGDDTVTSSQLREMIDASKQGSGKRGPVGQSELMQRLAAGEDVSDEEIARRAGF